MPTDACLIPVSGKPIPTHQTIATSNNPTTTDESFKGTYLEWPNISVFVGHSGWPNQIVNFKQAARQISPLQTNGHGMDGNLYYFGAPGASSQKWYGHGHDNEYPYLYARFTTTQEWARKTGGICVQRHNSLRLIEF